nr:hypothetical protein CFP56_63982 [Quercus suber]
MPAGHGLALFADQAADAGIFSFSPTAPTRDSGRAVERQRTSSKQQTAMARLHTRGGRREDLEGEDQDRAEEEEEEEEDWCCPWADGFSSDSRTVRCMYIRLLNCYQRRCERAAHQFFFYLFTTADGDDDLNDVPTVVTESAPPSLGAISDHRKMDESLTLFLE